MNRRRVLTIVACALVLGCVLTIGALLVELFHGSRQVVQTIASPDRRHTAKLIRQSDSELRFMVELDGRRVFCSSDFHPDARLELGETIAWDRTGKILNHPMKLTDSASNARCEFTLSTAESVAYL